MRLRNLALITCLGLAACAQLLPGGKAPLLSLRCVADADAATRADAPFHSSFNHFITRDGSRLLDGGKPFRFISLEVGAVHRNEDDVLPDQSDRWPNEYEIRDQFQTVAQAGGTATRIYTLSLGADPRANHVLALGKYNETAFRTLDKVMQVANENHVRVIFPLIDQYKYWGGVPQLAAWCGTTDKQFYSNPQCLAEYKKLAYYVLNRRNVYTGVQYKNDKTILAWQLGNELWSTAPWESAAAAYLKSIDKNHLVMAGEHNSLKMLGDPNVDILDAHIYQFWSGKTDLAGICRAFKQKIGDKKALIVGECGMGDAVNIIGLYDEVIRDGTTGCILWKALGHNRRGGFRVHNETPAYASYHWPGFARTTSNRDEIELLRQTREKAYAIRNAPMPSLPKPAQPTLLPIASAQAIYWRGATGAQRYEIDRAGSASGPWTPLSTQVSDDREYPAPEYADTTAGNGARRFYRVRAINSAGASKYSNTVEASPRG